MDYDDSDFQSQTFQLAGEENNNFPLGLRSYSLPKFDLDDNLQVNLRFDSLVESEALLGIQGQEQNQWIEDFSGGSSGLEFNSSAAESCSISRRNNVWSEATSSESVEMLLKSVGQDEMIMEQTIIEEPDACDGLGNLANEMELKSSQDGCVPSSIGDIVDVKSTPPTVEGLETLRDLSADAANQLPMVDVTPQIEGGRKSGSESSRDLDPISVGQDCNLEMTEGNIFIKQIDYEANKEEEGPSDRFGGRIMQDYSEAIKTSLQVFATNGAELNNQHIELQAEDLRQLSTQVVGEHQSLTEVSQMEVRNCKGNQVETSDYNVAFPLGMAVKVGSTTQVQEVSSEEIFPYNSVSISKCQEVVSCSDTQSAGQNVGNTQEVSFLMGKKDNSSCSPSVDVDSSTGGISSSPVLVMNSLVQITQEDGDTKSAEKHEDSLKDAGSEYPLQKITQGHNTIGSTEKQMNLSEDAGLRLASRNYVRNNESVAVSEGLVVQGEGEVDKTVDTSKLVVEASSSTSIIHVSQEIESVKNGDVLRVHGDGLDAEAHISSSMHVENSDRNSMGFESSDVHSSHSDVSIFEKDDLGQPIAPNTGESKPDGSLSLGKIDNDHLIVHGDGLGAEAHISSSMHVENSDRNSVGVESIVVHSSHSDVSILEKDDPGQPNAPSAKESETGGSLSLGKNGNDDLIVHETSFCAEAHMSCSMHVESTQKPDRILIGADSLDVHISQSDVSEHYEDMELCKDPGKGEHETDGFLAMGMKASSSSLSPTTNSTELMDHETTYNKISVDESVSIGGVQNVCEPSCNGKSDGADQPPSKSSINVDEAFEDHKDVKSPQHVEELVISDTVEKTLTGSSEDISSIVVKMNAQIINSVHAPEIEQSSICGNSTEMLDKNAGQPSSSLVDASTTCCNEPQAITLDIADQKRSIEEDSPVVHDSPMKGNKDAEVVGISSENHERANVKIAGSHGEASKQSIPPSLDESSCDIRLQSLDVKEAGNSDGVQNLVAGTYGDIISSCKESCTPATMLRDDSVSHSLEAAISFRNSTEANCGSHAPIGLNELSQSEKENQDIGRSSMGQNALASDSIIVGVKGINSAAHNYKENNTSKDDKGFTLEVNSGADIAQGKSDHERKTLPCIQPNESPQGLPSTTSGLGQISRGSPLKSGGKHTHRSAKCNTAEKTTPLSGKSSGRKSYNKGKLLKDEVPQNEKEPQEADRGCLNQSTPVCYGIIQKPNVVSSISSDPKGKHAVLSDRSLNFESCPLEPLSVQETCNGWKPIPSTQPCEYTQTVGASPLGISQIDPKILQEMSRGSARTSGVKSVRRSSKGNVEDKARLFSGKVVDRETAKQGKHRKELTPVKQSKENASNLFNASPSAIGVAGRVLQADELRPFGFTEGSSAKPCAGPTVQAANLPDLNASASQSALFWQPFTDFQQVQLRAQIFVYGSLIQGAAPDEACMVSAFGDSDRGRSAWENVWRIAVERLQNQKSPLSNPETPLHLHSGAKMVEPGAKQIFHQSEVVSTPTRAGKKSGPLTAIMNPMIPLSSPVWSISTPREGLLSSSMMRGAQLDSHQTLFPLQPYQSPQLRHYIGPTTPWQSQVPSPATWVVTPQTAAVESSAHFPVLPVSETVHISSVRESPVPRTSVIQPVPPSPVIYTGGSTIISTGTSIPMDIKNATAPSGKYVSSDVKPRKRKKSVASVDLAQISFVHPHKEPVSSTIHCPPASVATSTTPISSACKVGQISFSHPQEEPVSAINHHPSTSVAAAVTPVSSVSKIGTAVLPISPVSSTHHQIMGGGDTDQRVIFSEETCSKIEQAKQQAEDAAALAASAVKHSQSIWSQLAIQKNSGLVSDIEAKLASSAVAIAAAASVAKAAAAAAKVAFDAAVQAKMMADEALGSSKPGMSASEASLHDGMRTLGKVTPASILKGKDRTNTSGSVLVAAKEGAKKRVEAASAATRRAENLDAVVKAAELAAEAVSQAGAIVAMGDPIPLTLSELVVAGPEGHWKVQTVASEPLVKSKTTNRENIDISCVQEGLDMSAKHFTGHPTVETTETTNRGKVLSPKEIFMQSSDKMWAVNERWGSFTSNEKGLEGKKISQTSELAKTIGIVPESQIRPVDASFGVQNEDFEQIQTSKASKENEIEEGSAVEVFSYVEGLRRVWSPAKVLSLQDGKALVCYSELARDEASGPSKDWVPLDNEDGKGPRIRIPHPASTFKHDGTRKRSREARGDYVWSVGDKVDAWMDHSWWEGVVTEKSKEDETNITVQFSDGGDKSVVRSWNLRPSLFWKDGKWVECFSLKGKYCSYPEGDTRQDKRPKLFTSGVGIDSAIEARGKDNMSKDMGTEESGKLEASLPLALSEKERVFTMGKSSNSGAHGTKRTGLQQEGSRAIVGAPKPGKKRKFMDVSKHFVAGKSSKASEGSDSIKFAKFLIPQESAAASRGGWKNPSKVVPKGKRAAESRPKVLKTGKIQSSLGKNSFDKDCSSTSILPASVEGAMHDHLKIHEASATLGRNLSEKQKPLDHGPFPNSRKATESQVLSSSDLVSDGPHTKKKSSSVMSSLGNRGKAAPSGEKLVKFEEKDAGHNSGKSMPDAVEPRRSNRRIQPTSRLLEGLQSSLTISKIPTSSHDKGPKSQQRSAASRGSNHG